MSRVLFNDDETYCRQCGSELNNEGDVVYTVVYDASIVPGMFGAKLVTGDFVEYTTCAKCGEPLDFDEISPGV